MLQGATGADPRQSAGVPACPSGGKALIHKLNSMRSAAILGLAAAGLYLTPAPGALAQARTAPESFADLAAQLLPSVVNISTTQVSKAKPPARGGSPAPDSPQVPPGSPFEEFFKDFFDRNPQENRPRRNTSLGSGFI